jgi:hypothetical protein
MALPKLSSDRRTRETLEDMLDADDPYLRVDVVRALGDLGDVKARGALQRQLDRDLDGRVRRRIREVLRDLGGSGKREVDRLRDELEDLRREHTELKTRLGKLEAGGAAAKAKASAGAGAGTGAVTSTGAVTGAVTVTGTGAGAVTGAGSSKAGEISRSKGKASGASSKSETRRDSRKGKKR